MCASAWNAEAQKFVFPTLKICLLGIKKVEHNWTGLWESLMESKPILPYRDSTGLQTHQPYVHNGSESTSLHLPRVWAGKDKRKSAGDKKRTRALWKKGWAKLCCLTSRWAAPTKEQMPRLLNKWQAFILFLYWKEKDVKNTPKVTDNSWTIWTTKNIFKIIKWRKQHYVWTDGGQPVF